MDRIDRRFLDSSIDYATFRREMDDKLAAGQEGLDAQALAMYDYTLQNAQRMRKWEKTLELQPSTVEALEGIGRPMVLLTLAEHWCGDVSQVLPVMEKLCAASPGLELRILYRDEHLDLMDAFLTNGGRSIPKTIFLDPATGEVLGTWGPRPAEAQALMADIKRQEAALPEAERPAFHAQAIASIHLWYAKDKGRCIQSELTEALRAVQEMRSVEV